MVGRLFTPEDEIDVLEQEIARTEVELARKMRAPSEGRMVNREVWLDSCANLETRLKVLRRQKAGAIADEIAAAEALECGGVR